MTEPDFTAPMLATSGAAPVTGTDWVLERKLDGIRLIAVGDPSGVRLFTRNHLDRTTTYPELAVALHHQPCKRFVLDGEVVAFDGTATSFARLQQRSAIDDPAKALATGVDVVYYAFDLVHLEGRDTRSLPLRSRKALLRDAFDFVDPLRFSPHREGNGRAELDQACADGWEGLVVKRADSTYRSGRSRDWVKLKCVLRQELVIGGYTDPKGTRSGFGALLVGYHDDVGLRYAGKVGTGFDDAALGRLSGMLSDRHRADAPFVDPPPLAGAHWTTPDLVCEVGFSEWTTAGLLRHPRYLGLREDKDPHDVVRERRA